MSRISFAQWKQDHPPVPAIDVGGFRFNTLGASLHEVDGNLALAVLVGESDGTSIVLALTAEQTTAARALLPIDFSQLRALHEWLGSLSLDDNQVLGWTTNEAAVALISMSEGERTSGEPSPPT